MEKSSPSEFQVMLDELIGNSGGQAPKAVEGLGTKLTNEYGDNLDDTSGVLTTSNHSNPVTGQFNPLVNLEDMGLKDNSAYSSTELDERMRKTREVRNLNDTISRAKRIQELNEPTARGGKGIWNNDINAIRENIPKIALTAGAGATLLAANNAEAAPIPGEISAKTKGSVSLTKPVEKSESLKLKERLQESTIPAEIEQFKAAMKRPRGLVTEDGVQIPVTEDGEEFNSPIDTIDRTAKKIANSAIKTAATAIIDYRTQKAALQAKTTKQIQEWEASGREISDKDKEIYLITTGMESDNLLLETENTLAAVNHDVALFKSNVLDPIIHEIQGINRKYTEPARLLLREHAPSLAVIAETFAYPSIGKTGGYQLGEQGADTDPETLDPIVQKLIQDKSTLLGSDAGAALLSFATGYRDLPVWLIGGGGKIGLIVGGAANEAFKEEGNLLKGGAEGLVGGTALTKLMRTKLGTKTLGGMIDLGKHFSEHFTGKDLINWTNKYMDVQPLALITSKNVQRLADNVLTKGIDATKTDVITPQAIVMDVLEDGEVKLYGVNNGEYGLLPKGFKNKEGKPVLTTSRTKKVWVDNTTLRDTYSQLTNGTHNPGNRANSMDEWTSNLIPPENPDLMFAWNSAADGDSFMEVYRAGSHQFDADLLRSRNLVSVEYGIDPKNPKTGLGYLSPTGVVFAPDAAENIPNAIPHDLVIKSRGLETGNKVKLTQTPNFLDEAEQAWQVKPIVDDENLFRIIDHIKGQNAVRIEMDFENLRGSRFPDGINIIQTPAPFDDLPVVPPSDLAGNTPSPIPPEQVSITVQDMLPTPSDAGLAGALIALAMKNKATIAPTTSYGEAFKVDAAGIQFSLRHFKRLSPDLKKQFAEVFGTAQLTDAQRVQLSNDIRNFVEGNRTVPPSFFAPKIQAKVNAYTNERNSDYALIKQLGGDIPKTSQQNYNADLEKMFAKDFLQDSDFTHKLELGSKGKTMWSLHVEKAKGAPLSVGERMLLDLNKGTAIGKLARESNPSLFGRQNIETELAHDYMERKMKLTTLAVMKELADNPQASSPIPNDALGHTKLVDFIDSGLLTGKYVSEETYDAIYTFPQEQKEIKNSIVRMIDKIKYNKTVLNPMVWTKNIMGNVWGAMNSNIVPVISLFGRDESGLYFRQGRNDGTFIDRMGKGIWTMRQDLKAYEQNLMDRSNPAVERVHETLKFGILGAEFDSTKRELLQAIDNLQEGANNKSWGEKLQDLYFKAKDNSLGALGNMYSKVDMATKYSLYVNGIDRWGIDLKTNKLDPSGGRYHAGKLLGYSTIANMSDDMVAEAVKRGVVRRIYLSLPMVDRTAPVVNKLAQSAGLLNPWMRTAFELARITAQMPWRAVNEKGYMINAAKNAGFLFGLYQLNRHLRQQNGISDEETDYAWRNADDNMKKFMPGGMATPFRASDGGIVFIDMGDQLVESAQWFTGNEQTPMPQRVLMNLLQTVYSGSVIDNEAKALLSGFGLAEETESYQKKAWKRGDWQRASIDLFTRLGPQWVNNGWHLYSSSEMPSSQALKMDKPTQPWDIQTARFMGLDVASLGTENQKDFKRKQLISRLKDLHAQQKSANRENEGAPTGVFQKPFNWENATKRIDEEIDKINAQLDELDK